MLVEYSCAVLSDCLLLLELRDGIHEGDGKRLDRCWKLMLLYFFFSGHRKYALEALKLQAAINATVSERLAQEMLHSRFINTQGGEGKNIPTDLYMEHLNRTLKDHLSGLGANIIVQTAESLKSLLETVRNFDNSIRVNPESLHHTRKSSNRDEELIIKQLTDSQTFHYIPCRLHLSYKNIKPRISDCINMDNLVSWTKQHQSKMADTTYVH